MTVHRSLQHLQPVDLPFCLAVAPGLGDRIANRAEIQAQRMSAGSCLEDNDAVSLHIGPQARVLDRFGKNFDGTTERLPDKAFKSNQPNEIHLGRMRITAPAARSPSPTSGSFTRSVTPILPPATRPG
jgi:hypothetical protein